MAMAKEADVRGSFNIGTLDDNVWQKMEPGATRPKVLMEVTGHLS
ncbi:uncharacterized protein METZ01_LOCUS463522 [marine metagenome]|uniref:Uncharacterized protein n=1 Tax=marine metagenome TaxID=408172 RepID=A0A383AU47_9ZZZZ